MRMFVASIVTLVCLSSCEEVAEQLAERNGMRAPGPVIVDMPQVITDTLVPDSFFLVSLSDNLITVKYEGNVFHPETFRQLSRLVGEKGGKQLEGKVALKCDSTAYRRIDSAIKTFKENDILKFRLITGPDKHP